MTVYRDYDQAGLDAQYNNRARHPDHAALFRQWAETSVIARTALAGHLDLAYGPTAKQTLDIFPAATDGRAAPVLVFIHGGYWQSLDKSDFSYLAPPFVEAGATVAVLNYDLCPAVRIDDIVAQCRAALAWLHRSAESYGGDPDRLYLCGHSAGGHLAAMMLAGDPARSGHAPAADPVRGACAISGLYDLEPIRLSYLNAVLRLDPDEAARNSPARLAPRPGARLVLAVGGDETDEYLRQQADLAERWSAAGAEIRTVAMPGRHHFTIVNALAQTGDPLFEATLAMVRGG